jgi:outer membrane protein TolC
MQAADRVPCTTARPLIALALLSLATASVPPATGQEQQPTAPPAGGQEDATKLKEPQKATLELSLEAALDLARANNLDLELGALDTQAARYDFLGSWGAFEWVFDGRVAYIKSEFEPQDIFQGSGSSVETTTENYAFDLTKPMTTGGRFQFGFDGTKQESTSGVATFPDSSTDLISLSYVQPFRRGAWEKYATSFQREREILYREQIERERFQRHSVLLSVHNAYWELVAALEFRDVATSALALGREQLDQNQRRLDAGVGTEVEVLQAQAEVATRTELLLSRTTAVYQAMDDLKTILFPRKAEAIPTGWEAEIVPITPLPESLGAEPVPSWEQVLVTALENRPDLAQSRLEIDRAKLLHARALSERLSGVDLTLRASSRGLDTQFEDAAGEAATFEFPTYSAMLSYNMPIGNKTADYAARRTSTQIRAAIIELDRSETIALADVRRALREVEYQAEAVRAAEKSLELARRQLEAEQTRYAADLSTNFQVLEFQQEQIVADANWRRARVNYAKALVALRNAQGLIDEHEENR